MAVLLRLLGPVLYCSDVSVTCDGDTDEASKPVSSNLGLRSAISHEAPPVVYVIKNDASLSFQSRECFHFLVGMFEYTRPLLKRFMDVQLHSLTFI